MASVRRLWVISLSITNLSGGLDQAFKRSYIRRRGFRTKAQKRALRDLWPTCELLTKSLSVEFIAHRYGVDLPTAGHPARRLPLNMTKAFGRDAPLILDVGVDIVSYLAAVQLRRLVTDMERAQLP